MAAKKPAPQAKSTKEAERPNPAPAPSRGGPPPGPAPKPAAKPAAGGKPMPGLPPLPTGPTKPKPIAAKPAAAKPSAAKPTKPAGGKTGLPAGVTRIPGGYEFDPSLRPGDAGYTGVPEGPPDLGIPEDTGAGPGPGPGPGPEPGPDYGVAEYVDPWADYFAQQEGIRQRNAIATVKALLDQYNLGGLYDTIVQYIKDGYDANTVMVLIRTTPQYKQRFPAMEALAKKGRAISEAEYINYEQMASGLERRYGLPDGMLMGTVTNLLSNEVSLTELNDRVVLASAAAIQAPQDVKETFNRYYGIGQGGLTAYFLDPDVATPLLEKQYAASLIGTEAARQGVGIDVYGAQNLQALGITQEQAREGFGTVARETPLTVGRGDVTTQEELIGGTLGGSQTAQANIERARQARLGRFQGGGQFVQGQARGEGAALRSSATT